MGLVHIHALGINVGGGLVLLRQLLDCSPSRLGQCVLDMRVKSQISYSKSHFFKHGLISEYKSQKLLSELVNAEDHVLFFSNRPPLIRFKCRVSVFHQNAILLQKPNVTNLRNYINHKWLKVFAKNTDQFVVQNHFMQMELERVLSESIKRYVPINILPFFREIEGFSNQDIRPEDYIYVASSHPNKNHIELLKAWEHLASRNIQRKLTLVFSDEPNQEVLTLIKKLGLESLVSVQKKLSRQMCLDLLKRHKSLVYPSIRESFGLPLLEAERAGLTIVASERDYVRDIVSPSETFDPSSHLSIARAIMRNEEIVSKKVPLLQPSEFLQKLQEDSLDSKVRKAS